MLLANCLSNPAKGIVLRSLLSRAIATDVPLPAVPCITSFQNSTVKHLTRLVKSKQARTQHQELVLTGKAVLQDLRSAGLLGSNHCIYLPPNYTAHCYCKLTIIWCNCSSLGKSIQVRATFSSHPPVPYQSSVPHIQITPEIARRIAHFESNSTDLLAWLKYPAFMAKLPLHQWTDEYVQNGKEKRRTRILVLHGIRDPGNLGTLFRTANFLGWDAIFMTGNSVDPFNDKALRSSRGSAVAIPWCLSGWSEIIPWWKMMSSPRQLLIADVPSNCKALSPEPGSGHVMLVLCNEAQGTRDLPILNDPETCSQVICIPSSNSPIDSLNVASAGSILMWSLK
jgi:TrmH family RNA methyltransferase